MRRQEMRRHPLCGESRLYRVGGALIRPPARVAIFERGTAAESRPYLGRDVPPERPHSLSPAPGDFTHLLAGCCSHGNLPAKQVFQKDPTVKNRGV